MTKKLEKSDSLKIINKTTAILETSYCNIIYNENDGDFYDIENSNNPIAFQDIVSDMTNENDNYDLNYSKLLRILAELIEKTVAANKNDKNK